MRARYRVSVVSLKSDLHYAAVIAVPYVTSRWTGPRYNGTRVYLCKSQIQDISQCLRCIMFKSTFECESWNIFLEVITKNITLFQGALQTFPIAKCTLTVREITKSSSTFSATNISSNVVGLLQLHYTIQTKSNFGTKFSSIHLSKWEKRLVFRLSFVNLQRANDGTHMFDAKYWYVFVV